MTLVALLHTRRLFALLGVLTVGLAAGCAAPQATTSSTELPFDEAVAQATDGLVSQTQKLPAFLAKVEAKLV